MTSNVVPFPERGVNSALSNALSAELDTVIIIGWTKAGLFWTDSTATDGGAALWLIEKAKARILDGGP